MKKLIFISILSLIFMAAGAQRSSRSGSSDKSSDERKKSEMTVRRSSDQKSRSYDSRQNDNNRSTTYRSNSGNNNRSNDNRSNNNNSTTTNRTRSNTGNNNNSGNWNTTERIDNRRTDVHKNNTRDKAITYKSRRVNSTSGRSDNTYNNDRHAGQRKVYHTPNRTHYNRHVTHVNRPRSIEYRRVYHAYRAPVYTHVVWTNRMYREYRLIYPEYRYWYYPVGYRINTISAYDAGFYIGEVMNVYGKVSDVWYSRKTDEYFLHFGAHYPYHDFTVIIPGRKARQFSRNPEFFFNNRYIWATGLISLYDGKPEMIVRKTHQINLY